MTHSRLGLVQILRFIAAMFVVMTHVRGAELVRGDGFALLPEFTQVAGLAGVDLFFVISGFVMSYVSVKFAPSAASSARFIASRLFRIYPTWWLFLGIFCALMVVNFGTPWSPVAKPIAVSGAEHVLRSVFLLPQPSLPILNVGWTLIHEQYFYIVFALLLFLPARLRIAGLLIWALIPIIAFLFGAAPAQARTLSELLIHPMTLEFIAGAIVGWLFTRNICPQPVIMFVLGVIGFILVAILTPLTAFQGDATTRVMLLTLPCTLMVYGAAGLQNSIQNNKMLTKASVLGDWSYTLYLGHPIVVLVAPSLMEVGAGLIANITGRSAADVSFLQLGAPGLADNIVFIAAVFTGAILLAVLTHYLFEAPLIRWFRKLTSGRREKPKDGQVLNPPL